MNNIPKISQNSSGVLLKDGISIKSPVIVPPSSSKVGVISNKKKDEKEVMPKQIKDLNELYNILFFIL